MFVLLKTRIIAAALQLVVAVQFDGHIVVALHGDGGFARIDWAVTADVPSALPLTSIFRSSKVTSTLPLEVSMVTVFLSDSPVMTVLVSSLSMVSHLYVRIFFS